MGKRFLGTKIKEKYFFCAYVIVLLIGVGIIFMQGMNIESSLGVRMNVSIRLTLFLLNMTIPYILWQHFYSNLLFNHQKVQDNRRYIWRSRQVTFKERTKYSVIYLILAISIAIFSLKIFGSSYTEEAFWLIFAGITTILFPLTLLYLYSSKSIRHSYKNVSKDKIYSLLYIQRLQHEKVIKESEMVDGSKAIILESTDAFDIETIKMIHQTCNGIIFYENDINRFYNIFNLKLNSKFDIKGKGRFLSLIYLLQSIAKHDSQWDRAVLKTFEIDYEKDYMKNRKKYINDDIYIDSKMSFMEKMEHIKDDKANIDTHK